MSPVTKSIMLKFDQGNGYPDGFWPWLDSNWHIYHASLKIVRTAQSFGRKRWGMHGVLEVLRWNTMHADGVDSPLKINNNASAGLSRLLMAREPGLDGFFRTRCAVEGRRNAYRLDGTQYKEGGGYEH